MGMFLGFDRRRLALTAIRRLRLRKNVNLNLTAKNSNSYALAA